MKTYLLIITVLLTTTAICQENKLGKARIIDINYFYEYPDSYHPFDFTQKNECNANPLIIKHTNDNLIRIKNKYADCYTSNTLELSIDSSMSIFDVKFHSSSDNLSDNEGASTTVDQFILYMNKNPFRDTINLIGRYSAIIRHCELGKEYFYPFDGKFKIYAQSEGNLTKNELRLKMEKDMGFIDDNGTYTFTESEPEFCYGSDSLINYLKNTVEKNYSSKHPETKFYFDFIINNSGEIDSIEVSSKADIPTIILNKIKEDIIKTSCWIPAVLYGKTVKSTLHPYIEIEK